jgi:hypothetical protein
MHIQWDCSAKALGRGAVVFCLAFLGAPASDTRAAEPPSGSADEPWLRPNTGPERADIDPTTLDGKVRGLKMSDGSPARLYSAFRKGPVLLRCKWMRQYGIDGVFLSRFVSETTSPDRLRHVNTVLANVREGTITHAAHTSPPRRHSTRPPNYKAG